MRQFVLLGLLCAAVVLSINAGIEETNLPPRKQILFICTGNYYRSRFAAAFFNQKAGATRLHWTAISRGLQLFPSQHGISSLARRELNKRGVPPDLYEGAPRTLTKEDLEKSDYIVLVNEAEHRPMLEKQFPTGDDRKLHYWHIGDTDKMTPAKACQAMSRDIEELLQTLAH